MSGDNLAYRLRVYSGASFRKLNGFLDQAHDKTGRSRIWLFNDILRCAKKFGSGYHDYIMYHFYDLDDATKDTFLTRMRSRRLVTQFNAADYCHCFDNKNEFDEIFADYIKRDYIDMINATDEEIIDYYNTHDRTFAKMLDLSCGHGAELLDMADFDSGAEFCEYVRAKGFGVLEDVVVNHHELAEINPYAVNTMRMVTLIGDDGEPNLLFAAQKFGNGKRIVDVFGMHAPIDTETGVISVPFHSGNTTSDVFYTKHPTTGRSLEDLRIPFFKEAKEMILEASMVVPQMRYIGWDVAVTENGPLIIEGNNYSAYDYMQLPGQTPEGTGIIPKILKIVPSFKYK